MKNLYFATVLGFQAAKIISSISLGRPNSARDYPIWWSGWSSRWATTFGNQYCVAQRWKRFLIEIKSIPLQCNMCLTFRKHICLLRTVERIYSYNFFSNNVYNIFSVWQVAFTLSLLSRRVQNELLTHVRYLILSPWQSSEMELEIPKILVPRLPQNISNLNIESTGKLKQLYYLSD